jgi:hypothetical protein
MGMKKSKKKKSNTAKENQKGKFFPPRLGNGFQTLCDVDIHPDDKMNFLMNRDVRHVGTGKPYVKTLSLGKGLKTSNPCLYEAAMAHEKVHVNNATNNCKAFKKCLDDEVANNWVSNKNSTAEYKACQKTHSNGLASNCKADEQQAYAKSVKVGEKIVLETKCASEKSNLEKNIIQWKKYAKTPPNC